jgi:parvulin-like peptidyl-prolyl isomerase
VIMLFALWAVNRKGADQTLVRVKHILVKFNAGDAVDRSRALETIKAVQEQIKNGASFNRLAREYSNDEFSSARGGDLGYNPRGIFEPEFEKYVWSAPVGQVSDIVQSKFGFHLIVVTDRNISKADEYELDLEKKAVDKPAPSPAAGS